MGSVIASPFISPGEKEIAGTVLKAGGSAILMKPDGFDCYFKPRGKYFDLCLEGKLLILSCRQHAPRPPPLNREICLTMNKWCSVIAGVEAEQSL